MADLSKLTTEQLLELKSAGGDLSKVSTPTLMALKGGAADAKPAPFLERAGRYARGLIDEAANLGTGLSDEFGAAVDAAAPTQFLYPTSQAETWKQRYDENLGNERGRMKAFRNENPVAATAANITGGLVGSAALLGAGPAALTSMGPSLPINALKSGAVGLGLGAAGGYGEGEGSGRIGNALVGGAFGAGTGAALPFVGRGASLLYDRVAPNALSAASNFAEKYVPRVRPNALSAAAPDGTAGVAGDSMATRFSDTTRNAATKIEDDAALNRLAISMSDRGGPQAARQRLNALGEGAFLGDVSKGTERLAFVTQANSDAAAERMLQAYTARNSATGTRFKSEVPEARDASTALRQMKEDTREVGKRSYGDMARRTAIDEPVLQEMPELKALYENPAIKGAINRVMTAVEESRVGRPNAPTVSDIELLHMIKREIQDLGFDKMGGRPLATQQQWRDLSTEFVSQLKAANPKLAAADKAYAESKSLPEWFERGRNFAAQGRNENALNASPEALRADMPNATPAQRNALAEGTASDMRRIASQGPDQTRRLAKSLTEGDDMVARLREILGDDVASRIVSRGDAERTFAEKFGNVMRGSQTAERNAALMRDQGISPPAHGDVMSVLRWVRDQADKLDRPSETVRRKLADLLTNPDAASNAETISLVEKILNRRNSGNALRAGVPGSVGNEAAR